MTLRVMRDKRGRVVGIVLTIGKHDAPDRAPLAPAPAPVLWRVCDICTDNVAVIYCRTHSVYLCLECVRAHELMDGARVVQMLNGYVLLEKSGDPENYCQYVSRAAAHALDI